MKNDMHFWITMLFRGFLALFAGSFVMVIPNMGRTLLLLPVAIVVSFFLLAIYGSLDSVLVLISSFMTESRFVRLALRSQGSIGLVIGTLFLSMLLDHVKPEWFLSLAAFQAFTAGIGEILVARHSITHSASIWNYAGAGVAFCASVFYLVLRIYFAPNLTPGQIAWFVYSYLVAFGIAQCLTAARMLYADRRSLLSQTNKAVLEA